MYTLDTNAIIYYLAGDRSAQTLLEELFGQDVSIYISTITEIELLSHSALRLEDVARINQFLNVISILPLDSQIARIAARYRRVYKMELADSAIAATALFTQSSLVTRNIKDFQGIPEIKLKKI